MCFVSIQILVKLSTLEAIVGWVGGRSATTGWSDSSIKDEHDRMITGTALVVVIHMLPAFFQVRVIDST